MVREDYEAGLSESYRNTDPATMTVAEKEKLKWMNPVNLPNNPYAPENLGSSQNDFAILVINESRYSE